MTTTDVQTDRPVQPAYDVVVAGGGAAGLSAGVTLARARRSVLVVDAGEQRNAPAAGVHGFLTRDGLAPAALVALGVAEVRSYGGHVVAGRVAGLEVDAAAQAGRLGFVVDLADGTRVTARRVVVATGLLDVLPEVTGVAEQWGRGVVHCPYCHGWEVRDAAIGVLSTGPMAAFQALLFRQWSSDVVLFGHTGPEPSEQEHEELAARGVAVVPGEVAALESGLGVVTGVRLTSGELVPRQVLVVGAPVRARDDLLAGLGLHAVETEVHGHVIGRTVPADPTGATTVPGVFVAGNVTDMRAQVVTAAAAGVQVAAAVNLDLVGEDTAVAVAAARERATG